VNAAAARPLPTWAVFAITFVAYLAMARLGLLLAIQPGNASPLFPAAGVGLAATFVWGRWAAAAVAAASLAANLWVVSSSTPLTATVVATWLGTASGAALQALVGAWLVRRFVSQPLLLSEPGDLARFMLMVTPVACVTSASIAAAVLLSAGVIDATVVPATWGAWWVGDTLGVLIGAPIVWAFIAAPRDAWAPRRWAVALPLALGTAVMALGILESMRAEVESAQRSFQRDADNVVNAVSAGLHEPLHALEALRGAAELAPAMDRNGFARVTAEWRADAPGITALGLSDRVERADIAAFEARERASGSADYRISERWPEGTAAEAGDWLLAIRFIEPLQPNARAVGVNSRSIARAREAIDRAIRTDAPQATASFALSQGGQGVVVYRALYRGLPTTEPERLRTVRGSVFVTVRPADLLRALAPRLPATVSLCLIDRSAAPGQRLLAGAAGCEQETASAVPVRSATLPFAGRQWDLRVVGNDAARSGAIGRTWPLALVGLATASLLGALLLTITGRARRIATAVVERTAELEQRSSELQAESVQRERTALALRESQQRLRSIFEHAPIGVAYTDIEGRIREANPHLRQMLGADVRVAGRPMGNLLHDDDRAVEAAARERLLAGDTPMARAQLRCKAPDGRLLTTRASISLLRSGRDNSPRRMVWVIEDISEHLALEEAQRAREGAEAANRAKSDFLSRMSHELRTPLNALLGFTQLLELDRKQPLAPHQLDWTAQMRHAGWHLLHMINDTLDLSRIESGHIELEPRTLDLQELVDSARALVQQAAEKRRVQIEAHLGTGARAVIGDATRVKQILTNLLSNAVKYNIEGGSVVMASRLADDGRVALDVIDTGTGMTPQQLSQLFQPFNRLGQEGGPVEGTGIGLVISLRLAELMGGTLKARSSPGMGSTFTLELPRAAVASVPARLEDDGLVEAAAYRRRVIHYVEDNETNAEVMRGILALRPQVDLEISTLGLDGLAAIKRRRPSLVLLDMQLPDIDGLELLRHLQADPETSEIPVIVVSADATEARVSQAIATGATHYLTKPVNVPVFLAAVDDVLDTLDTHFG
jgi:PAS domain S-box-containing protein